MMVIIRSHVGCRLVTSSSHATVAADMSTVSTLCLLLLLVPGPALPQYKEALELSLLFYRAQRSGSLGPDNKVPWRSDAHTEDRGRGGEDLSGGYYDAGDYVKFGFPLAFSLTMLAWGGLEFTAGYEDSGLMAELEEAVRWDTWPVTGGT